MTDADVDGSHIRISTYLLLYRYMKPMIDGVISTLLSLPSCIRLAQRAKEDPNTSILR